MLKDFSRSGPPRHELGDGARIAVIPPHILIYDYDGAEDIVTVRRIIHGRRDINAALLAKKP